MIKLAMARIRDHIRKMGLKSRMIMQVHDELVFDVLRSEADTLRKLILEDMQHAMPLPNNVPVIAEAGMGENWLEAH
jgi:DNA polymerase-1